MKNITIILDMAHGEEVPGKRSPDGKFREYLWSRTQLAKLKNKLISMGYKVELTNTTNREIGLSQRAANANKVPGKKILISLHSDAAGSGKEWMSARGFSIFTTKGQNNSDIIAEIIMKQLIKDFPELKTRTDKTDGDLDKEENFTLLVKANCPAVLIEWNFQDNKEDVEILMSENYNNRLILSLSNAINTINAKLA